MSVVVKSKNGQFVRSPAGDVLRLSMIGGVMHIPDRGVMVHGTDTKSFFWIAESDNDKARTIRDEISHALVPVEQAS